MKSSVATERFSGHESFACRYGWLPKAFKAIIKTPTLLRNEEVAMEALGIGRNMVKSILFWAEASGTIETDSAGGHVPGPVGQKLFGSSGWDPYLESLDSLWLIHWYLSTEAGLAAWNEVFGEGKLIRFERSQLITALAARGAGSARPLAGSTLEQHASIFIQSYFQEERNTDDTSWCPLQDLGLIKAAKADHGRVVHNTGNTIPLGLTARVFGMALVQFITRHGEGGRSVDFARVLKAPYSPGMVFRMGEQQIRQFVEVLTMGAFKDALRFIDTADTQSIVLVTEELDPKYRLATEELEYV
jgi:hypothetical protein